MSSCMIQMVDEVLVRRARAGDGAAFVRFATRWWPRIGRFAWGMLRNASQARAVTEEVIGAVLESPHPPELPVARFMYRLALWLVVVRRRANGSAVAAESPILDALDRLDHMDRAAFLLRDVEQLSLRETAAVLESSETEVQARIHRSRVLLTHLLGDLANALDPDFRSRRTG
jgi:DNA-directed RNA polymerase specialized sigma24 family protein